MQGRTGSPVARKRLPFRAVNRRDTPQFEPGLQRHHLLPCQLLSRSCFAAMLATIGKARIGFDDFRRNGMLLPSREEAAKRIALPLHRGPHRNYNAMVIERVGQIEQSWSRQRLRDCEEATETALMRLALLQDALRKRLLDHRRPLRLNRNDPLGKDLDFSTLDAMAEALWSVTG